jgi:CDP-glycerol glycerophosphotransferase (TagB/SpsB family)
MTLSLVNKGIYEFIQTCPLKIIIYMPTWRENSFNSNPINLDNLNKFAQDNGLFIIMKMHPFIRRDSFFDSIEQDKYLFKDDYSFNITFYPSTDDIYPILSHSDMLITDYSSIYFDYLLVNKPIVFFIYDKNEYLKYRGDFMLEFRDFTPGLKPENIHELKENILSALNNDTFYTEREKLRQKLFDVKSSGHSSEIIFNEIKNLSEKK